MKKFLSTRFVAVLSGALMLTACAETRSANYRAQPSSRTAGPAAMPEDKLPNPAKTVMEGEALERMQSGVVMGRRM